MSNKELVTKSKTIRDLLMKPENVDQFKMALPGHITAERFSRVALTTIMQNENLLNCDAASIMKSLIQSASLGLEVDGTLGHAYLIPYAGKATFQVGYKGLIALARRSGEVNSFCAQTVYSEDYFEFQYGTQEQLTHKPSKGERGEMIGAYAIVHFKAGGHAFDYMSKLDIDKIRKRSKSANSGPWVTDYDEMARKTVAKRLSKYLPLSAEFQQAAQLDEHYDLGLDEAIPSKAEEIKNRFNNPIDIKAESEDKNKGSGNPKQEAKPELGAKSAESEPTDSSKKPHILDQYQGKAQQTPVTSYPPATSDGSDVFDARNYAEEIRTCGSIAEAEGIFEAFCKTKPEQAEKEKVTKTFQAAVARLGGGK